MSITVEIRDKDASGASIVHLTEILHVLEPLGRRLSWAVLDLYATGDATLIGENIPELERRIAQSANGVVLTWDALVALASGLEQIIDVVILGVGDVNAIPKLEPEYDPIPVSEFVIEAIDGSVWRIYAKDDAVLEQIVRKFGNVDVIRT